MERAGHDLRPEDSRLPAGRECVAAEQCYVQGKTGGYCPCPIAVIEVEESQRREVAAGLFDSGDHVGSHVRRRCGFEARGLVHEELDRLLVRSLGMIAQVLAVDDGRHAQARVPSLFWFERYSEGETTIGICGW